MAFIAIETVSVLADSAEGMRAIAGIGLRNKKSMSDNNHIDAVTPWGKFTVWGKDLILILMMAAFIGATFWEQKQREVEHQDISCLLRLQIWTTIASEADLSLRRIPKEYWRCLPEAFLRLQEK